MPEQEIGTVNEAGLVIVVQEKTDTRERDGRSTLATNTMHVKYELGPATSSSYVLQYFICLTLYLVCHCKSGRQTKPL